MATTKPAAKAIKTAPEAAVEYRMPLEVADWIKQAESRISYLTTKNVELKEENVLLRKANKVMEARVMGQSQE
ncbi:hypothetical protein UFOVP56_43 [uncultured Caudovirales phage]|uniref:Uncharacterized protein n=1 Tax=uncultured Caudovirales phage TaxID=2100421 RepID=A0A6J5T808_9CAUD|nr:hypothetical protein UFOVP56_43 [uncultured Caudovirales phage]